MPSSDPLTFWPRIGRRALLRMAAGLAAVRPAGAARAEVSGAAEVSERGRIWAGVFDTQEIFGYVDRHSVVAGQPFAVMLSRKPGQDPIRGRLQFFRLGDYPWGRKLVWTSPSLTVGAQPVLRAAAAVGAGWLPALDVDTADWPPGCYTADFEAEGRPEPYYNLVQTIVRPRRTSSRVLVKLSTNTWQAYNIWGGHSLYPDDGPDAGQRGAMVSFDRPTPAALFEYEVYLLRWIEALAARSGFGVDYAANFDVHSDPELLASYPLVICGSHDEYWSREEFDAFERRILHQGRNTIFFGANTGYWQVRYADLNRAPGSPDLGRQLVCHKSLDDPIVRRGGAADPMLLATARYRERARRPESMLMGAAYQNWFQPSPDGSPRYGYRVARTDLPFFAGTGLEPGDILADVIGYEWDCRDPNGDGRRLWDADRSRIAALPADSVKVLFAGRPVAADGKPGLAEAVYFESPAGAKVFNAGSIRWAWGFGRPGFAREPFRRFNENLVLDLLRD